MLSNSPSYTSSYLQNKNRSLKFLIRSSFLHLSFLQMCCLGKKNIVLLNSLGLCISQSNARTFKIPILAPLRHYHIADSLKLL